MFEKMLSKMSALKKKLQNREFQNVYSSSDIVMLWWAQYLA